MPDSPEPANGEQPRAAQPRAERRRVVTLTLNPALDLSSSADFVSPHHKLRCEQLTTDPGGGGINVSRVCRRLGVETVAVAPLGGALGTQLAERLADEGVGVRVVPIEGETRPSVTITEGSSGDQYRFVFPGPTLSPNELRACLDAAINEVDDQSLLVISGSLPEGVPPEAIGDLVAQLPNVPVIVDSSGPGLEAAMRAGAALVKPSARELAQLVGRELITDREVAEAAREALDRSNSAALIVSIGAGGCILVVGGEPTVRLRAPTVQVRSAVGAGDSMVAGIAAGLCRGLDLIAATELGTAAGTAAVLTPSTELCSREAVDSLLPDVHRA